LKNYDFSCEFPHAKTPQKESGSKWKKIEPLTSFMGSQGLKLNCKGKAYIC
jgi:hypothetical protein